MAKLTATFRGMNTDSSPNKLPSGSADVAANVILENGSLNRRKGFSEWEDDVSGSALSVVSGTVARFAKGGYVYAVVKCSNGTLYQRMVYPVLSSGFTAISGGQTHNGSDVGWWFMWDDAVYHFDRAGGTKWNPTRNSGTAYKAGIPRPTVGPIPFQAAGGEKNGFYHVHMGYRNSRTREEGVFSGTHTPYVECRIADNTGGIVIDNWSDTSVAAALARDGTVVGGGQINEQDSTYEWDQAVFFCTFGGTEYIGLGATVECFSYRAYSDAVKDKTGTTVGLNKSDECLDQRQPMTNTGGEPPKAQVGCFTGSRAIYGNIFDSACATLTTSQAARDADLTFEAVATGSGGNSITIEYTAGGTAGSEVVTVLSSAIGIAVESGVSTASQVLTALHGSAAAMALVTARLAKGQSGTGVVVTTAAANLAGGGTTGTSITPGIFRYSINGFPCMVPARVTYSTGGDTKVFEPQPWVGEGVSPCGGEFTAAAYGQGIAAFFTASAAYAVQAAGDGRVTLREIHAAKGAVCEGAAVGGVRGVAALGDKSWLMMGSGATRDIADGVFSTTIDAIPAARRNLTRGGEYSFADQTWFACAKDSDNAARRILVFDHQEAGGALTYFDLSAFSVVGVCTGTNYTGGKTTITATAAKFKAGMVGYTMTAGGSDWTITDYTNTTTIKVSGDATGVVGEAFSIDWDEGITGLCELAYPGATPSMLVLTNRGRILKYPDTEYDDGKGFACQWRGYFGQERMSDWQRIHKGVAVHTGDNCDGVVSVYCRPMQTGSATETRKGPVLLDKDNAVHRVGVEFDRVDANLFQLEFTSDASATAQWTVHDVAWRLERMND